MEECMSIENFVAGCVGKETSSKLVTPTGVSENIPNARVISPESL